MVKGTVKVDVLEHILLKNGWEVYVTERGQDGDPDIGYGLVCGFENEWGSFSFKEYKPYILSRTSDLTDLMPAPGYEWVD
jgi:hypothetical protein